MKTAGFLLLLFTIGYAFVAVSEREPRRLREAEGLYHLLRHIRGQMAAFSLPLPEIYATFSDEALEKCDFLPTLRKRGLAAALDGFAVAEKEREVFLLLRRFADGLGQGFLQEELAFCDYVITVYSGYLDKKRAECPVKRKLGRAMVLLGGGMILLFFL